MDNYAYCAAFAADLARGRTDTFAVLDYGCGAGQIVTAVRAAGVTAYGCDPFYGGGDYSRDVPAGLLGEVIRRMVGTTAPFPEDSFDLVVNNQVLEHVEDLDPVLAEMRRVLKPGGTVLSLFPADDVWREGHCGIPFLHWFPKGSTTRLAYAAGLRALGLGKFKKGKPYWQWSKDTCAWLDRWTYYRPHREIQAAFERHFVELTHREAGWLDRRIEGTRVQPLGPVVPDALKRIAARKLAGMVLTCRKPSAPAPASGPARVSGDPVAAP